MCFLKIATMEVTILSVISPIVLVGIGIFLMALEVLTFTFVLFWFGVAFIGVGVISYFVTFSDGAWQIASVGIISLVLLLFLRSRFLTIFLEARKGDEVQDDFFNMQGVGIVKNGKIYYKATYWDCDDMERLKEGQKVEILEVKKGKVKIKF
jgi:membrane protein implicated in regulation of membrane protease activity